MSDPDPEKKPSPIPLDYRGKPEPPIQLSYSSIPQHFSVPALIGGIVLGIVACEGAAFIAGLSVFTLDVPGRTPAQTVLMIIEFAAGFFAATGLLSAIFSSKSRREPFVIGVLAGVCAVILLNGVCWYSGG